MSTVELRHAAWHDVPWLTVIGLDPELVGVHFSYVEWPLQLVAAPLRALLGPFVCACIVELDGRRGGYIGRSPLSGSYEYMLRPWARGLGAGRKMIVEFFSNHRGDDRTRKMYVRHVNTRSWHTLRSAFDDMGWTEGKEYTVRDDAHHHVVTVGSQADALRVGARF